MKKIIDGNRAWHVQGRKEEGQQSCGAVKEAGEGPQLSAARQSTGQRTFVDHLKKSEPNSNCNGKSPQSFKQE